MPEQQHRLTPSDIKLSLSVVHTTQRYEPVGGVGVSFDLLRDSPDSVSHAYAGTPDDFAHRGK
jgi:hypothetical protein